jgi:tetratricopeptide (TPR) repeat protein
MTASGYYMRFFVAAFFLALTPASSLAQSDAARLESVRYHACLQQVDVSPQRALEEAQTWRMQAGGWPALHCEARALSAQGDLSDAARQMENLMALPGLNLESASVRSALFIEASDAWVANGDPETARLLIDDAVTQMPGNIELLFARAAVLTQLEDWRVLNTTAQSILELNPNVAAGWHYRALAQLSLGELEAARENIGRARALAPDDIDVLLLRGRILDARRTTSS